ncbi:MAG TPA: class I SAM-dependent methyltransferase, partial [Planctomycetes bacterium]|nr:class I SAM-dependent methyltransferase [Planctomycetota bacterium]
RSLWNDLAKTNAQYAIWGDPRVEDEENDEAFSDSGRDEAMRLTSFVHPSSRVVDLGCGIGRVTRELAPFVGEIIGVDVSDEMIEEGKKYLGETANARLILNDGATLAAIESDSVDFLFSLLCLIHADKRCAYRYMREIKRVLKPGGQTLLQFHNMLSDRGLKLFQAIVDSDYPLEFYTPAEVRRLLGSVGLEVLSENLNSEFIDVVALNGSRRDWIEEWLSAVSIGAPKFDGAWRKGAIAMDRAGRSSLEIENRAGSWKLLTVVIELLRTHENAFEQIFCVQGRVQLKPTSKSSVSVQFDPAQEEVALLVDGKPAIAMEAKVGAPGRGDRGLLNIGCIPAGASWTEETRESLPGFARTIEVELLEDLT